MNSRGNLSHSTSNAVLGHWMDLGDGLQLAIALRRVSQKCSTIGLKYEYLFEYPHILEIRHQNSSI